MSSISRIFVCGFSALLVSWSAPATAQTVTSFSIPIYATLVAGPGASIGVESITLPPTGQTPLSVNFMLPLDYVTNSPVTIRLLLAPNSAPCSMRLVPEDFTRTRAGSVKIRSLDGVSGGNQNVAFSPVADKTKVFTIAPAGALTDLKRSDAIMFQVHRDGDDISDTCPDVFVSGIEVRYTAQ